jgi:hypothetical protein
MKQVITFSDLHFIFCLELTQRTLMDVLQEHGMVMVFLIFMAFIASLSSVCVFNSLSANINPSIQPLEFPKCARCRWATLLCLDEDEHNLAVLLCLVQLEQHLLALVLLLPSSVQDVVWANRQWRACSFSHSQPLTWKNL